MMFFMDDAEATICFIFIIGVILIESLIVVVVGDWIARNLGMTGLTYYCTVFLFWLIVTGLLSKLLKD